MHPMLGNRVMGSTMAILAIATVQSHALAIRTYSATRHDRFTGFPSAPVLNTGSWFTGANYTGVGWLVSDTRRQFALVSPQHFVMPSHWGVGIGDQIRFLSSGGQLVTATIASTTIIQESSVNTDLTLGRFTAPIPTGSGVTAFPYASTSESYYSMGNPTRRALRVFGLNTRVGGGTLTSFFNVDLGNGTVTRMYSFPYTLASGGQDDSYFEDGDSGSPSFIDPSGSKPLLTGTHSAADRVSSTTTYTSYDTFVPHYVSQLNTLMATDGYQMIPSSPSATTLASSKTSTSPATLRRVQSGSATFTVSNSGSSTTNVVVTLTFPTGNGPTSVSGVDWLVETTGPDVWIIHRATLANAANAPFTVSWNSIPDVASLPVTVAAQSDGSNLPSNVYDLAPAVSYAQWSAALAQPAATADPDGDGRTNLVEYGFGGDPMAGTDVLAAGVPAGTVLTTASGTATLRFPVRSDSQVRGLTYVTEWSDNLTSWSQTAPGGTATTYQAYVPAVSGFKEAVVTFPANAARKFARVRVTLDETTAGMTVP
ncbi:hypothetical protein [Luteolibacter sp. LG18]|uniref:hypothetical protein n=1 Tax=Luteolibacter sp. LG18 TaxID=2819286 RepID=UPI0030C73706